MQVNPTLHKRGRDDAAPGAFGSRGRRTFDPSWYSDVGEGAANALTTTDDDLFSTVKQRTLGRGARAAAAAAASTSVQYGGRTLPGKTGDRSRPLDAAGQQRLLRMRRKDDAWHRQVLEASGVIDDEGEEGARALLERESAPVAVPLEVNDTFLPPFLMASSHGDFSRQQDIIIPLKDKTSTFAELSRTGSAALLAHKRAKREKQANREVADMKDNDLTALLADKDEMTEEELERLQRKQRIIEWQNATEAQRAELKRKEEEAAAREMRQKSSMKAIGDAQATERIKIAETRRQLPVYACRSELLRHIGDHSVSIIMGETGSGKTTQLVQYLYEAGYGDRGLIGCTQPRRMAAVGVAARVSDEIGAPLGTTVGYAIRLEDETSPETKIKFMTDGVLLREIVHDPEVRKYSVIVLDEAHERSVNTDVLLGVLKEVLRRRSDFKLIVTSATMDITKFCRFFANAPFYEIPGKTFEVDIQYELAPVVDYVEEAVMKICEIHCAERGNSGDILVFMTGKDDINAVCEMVVDRLREQVSNAMADTVLMLPCYSELPSDAQLRVLAPAPPGVRKVVVATNVAETSLTIDGIRFVIDPGYMKTNVFIPNIGMNTLQTYPVSQAQANQRKGRAGRTQAGVCHRLYTEQQFRHEMLSAAIPEIQRSSIDSVVLLLKSIGVADLLQFDFIDPPPEANLRSSLRHLWMLGAINDGGAVSADGMLMLEFPMEPAMAKVLVKSAELGCGEEVLGIIAMLNVDINTIFVKPPGKEEDASAAHEKFHNPESDHLTYFNVLSQYMENGRSATWARDHFINPISISRACNIRSQFHERMVRAAKLPVRSCEYDHDRVRECLAHGYFAQAAKRKQWTEYTTLLTRVACHVSPHSSLHSGGGIMPDYVIYNDFIRTTKEYMSCITSVKAEWLAGASRGVYTLKGDDRAKFERIINTAKQAAIAATEKKPSLQSVAARSVSTLEAQRQREGQQQLAKKKKVSL